MMLHRVLDDGEFFRSSSLPGILVRKQTFEQLLSWAAKNFEVLDLSKSVPDWDARSRSARVAFTFDDGWLDNYDIARPVILRCRVPTTIFVCPGLMGKPFPFWPERVSRLLARLPNISSVYTIFPDLTGVDRAQAAELVIEQLKRMAPELREESISRLDKLASANEQCDTTGEPLNRTVTWEQLQELHAQGIRIGSHTLSHPILTSVPEDAVRIELNDSRRQIEAGLGAPCVTLAYPNGNHNDATVRAAGEAGYTLAFTTKRGLWTRQTDLLRVPRVNIFEQKLTGPTGRFSQAMAEYSLFWDLKKH